MRPVAKWSVGQTFTRNGNQETVSTNYNPYGNANPVLQLNLGDYCSYCEVFSSDLEVEHVVAKHQDDSKKTEWDNFLLACGRCNGRDNKSNKHVDLNDIYLPHSHNTLFIFEYKEGGLIDVHSQVGRPDQITKAKALLDLVGLDKYPGNPKYPPSQTHPMGFPENDKRWEGRRTAWEKAKRKLEVFEKGDIDADAVAKFARERGFFSVWLSVFHAHPVVKQAMISLFTGTEPTCFSPNSFDPIPRNPNNPTDPI
ncbi:MAG: HNH endonuclease [Saprospiraceae bacterium]|nr:HNH endonuclease [Saprospiraceae bacterium]